MKITSEILTLTKEHHSALSLANKCINTAKTGSAVEIDALCLRISTLFKINFQAHFETEERTVFAPLKSLSIELEQLCNKLTDEHQQLYQLSKKLADNSTQLSSFGELLKSHSRTEDRQLFPYVKELSNAEKLAITQSSELHTSNEKI